MSAAGLPPLVEGRISIREVRADVLAFLVEQARRHGDVFRYESEGWSTVVVNHPRDVKHVLKTNHENYTKLGTPDLMMLRPMLGDGLMTSDGLAWEEQRAMLRPAFDPSRFDALVGIMGEVAGEMIEQWEAQADAGETIDVDGDLSTLTLRIVARCLFGSDLAERTTDFGAAVQAQNEFIAHFDPADAAAMARFREAQATIGRIVHDIVARHREGQRAGAGDMLDLMIASRWKDGEPLTERQIQDQIFTFLMAGHETTAKALAWTFHLLDENPDARALVRDEAIQVLPEGTPGMRDVSNLTYTWMVIQEALRLYPPAWLVSRTAMFDDVLGGYAVPSGSLVVISPYLVHRHPAYWPSPLAFDPARFSSEQSEGRDPYCYFPFGGGPRLCIGRRFAILESRVVLAMVARRLTLTRAPGHIVEPEALVTLRLKHGLRMRATRIAS